MFNSNAATSEVIALLLPDLELDALAKPQPARSSQATTALVRKSDGRMSLENVGPGSRLEANMMNTGYFRRGKPIIDPVSREVMGYEMEIVDGPLAFMR